jgi:hypothetical protein
VLANIAFDFDLGQAPFLREPANADKAFVVCPLARRVYSQLRPWRAAGRVWHDRPLLSSISPLAKSRH